MDGKYITQTGEIKTVLMFDEVNKMVYVNIEGSRHEWIHESEYSTWVKQCEAIEEAGEGEIADAISLETEVAAEEETVTETPKKKKAAPKKKTK